MPYGGRPGSIPIAEHPLVPGDQKPEACARLHCAMTIRRPSILQDADGRWAYTAPLDPKVGALFVHQDPDGSVDVYPISIAWLDDVDKDIWAEIRPWVAGLHDEVSR